MELGGEHPPPPGQAFLSSFQGAGGSPGPARAHARLPWEVASEAKIPFQDPRPCNSFLSHHLSSLARQQHSRFGISNFILKSLHFMYLNLSLNCISPDSWQELDSSLQIFYLENTLVHLKFISLCNYNLTSSNKKAMTWKVWSKGNTILGRKDLQISAVVRPGKPEKGPGEPVPGKRGHVSLLVLEERIFCIMQGSQSMGKGGFSCLADDVTDTPNSSGVGTRQQGPPLGEGDCTAGLSLAGARQCEAALREAEEGSPGRPRRLCAWGLVVKAQEELHQELILPQGREDRGDGSGSGTGSLCCGLPRRVGNTWFHE